MTAYFESAEQWHAAIAAAVREGLTFRAWSADTSPLRTGRYSIDYTGGF